MRAIIHYRDEGFYEHQGLRQDELNRNVVGFLVEGLFSTIIDARPFEHEIDNQCDYDDAHPGKEKYMNCYLVTDLDPQWIDNYKENTGNINNALLSKLKTEPPQVTQHWQCGNESYFVVETSPENPPVELDLDL